MSTDLSSVEAVERYAQDRGSVDGLRMMLAQDTVQGQRRKNVIEFLRQYDEREQRAQQQMREESANRYLERQTIASERQAEAAEKGVPIAEKQARFSLAQVALAALGLIAMFLVAALFKN